MQKELALNCNTEVGEQALHCNAEVEGATL
jgi:hypothetical protein